MNERTDFDAAAETTGGDGDYSRPDEIERRIENTRQRMSEDINALSNKLRPRNLAAQAGEALRRTGSEAVEHRGWHPAMPSEAALLCDRHEKDACQRG